MNNLRPFMPLVLGALVNVALSGEEVALRKGDTAPKSLRSNNSSQLFSMPPFSVFQTMELLSSACEQMLPQAEKLVAKYELDRGEHDALTIDSRFLLALMYARTDNAGRAFELISATLRSTVIRYGPLNPRTAAVASHLSEIARQMDKSDLRRIAARIAFAKRVEIVRMGYRNLKRRLDRRGSEYANLEYWLFAAVSNHSHTHEFGELARVKWIFAAHDHHHDRDKNNGALPDVFAASIKASRERGPRDDDTDFLLDLALLLSKLELFHEANTVLLQGRELCDTEFGKSSLRYADAYHVGALVAERSGDFAKAKDLLLKSEAIIRKKPANAIALAVVQKDLGRIHARLGSYGEARDQLEKAATTFDKELGAHHVENQSTNYALARTQMLSGDLTTALDRLERANAKESRGTEVFSYFAVDQVARTTASGNGSVAIAVLRTDNTDVVTRAFRWQTTSKGILLRAHRQWAYDLVAVRRQSDKILSERANTPATAEMVADDLAQQESSRLQQGRLIWNVVVARRGILHQPAVEEIDALRESFSKVYSVEPEKVSERKSPPQLISLDTLQDILPENTGFLEFSRYSDPWDDQERYAVWVVTRSTIDLIDLGSSVELERLIERLLREIDTAGEFIIDRGFVKATAKWRSISEKLSITLLGSMIDRLSPSINHLTISPDGALWNVPWAALVLPSGKFAIERFSLGLVMDVDGVGVSLKRVD